jgi:hypothetical protein
MEIMWVTSGKVYHPARKWQSVHWEVVESAKVKKSLRKTKVFLDKLLGCGTLSLVEKYAPTQSGRFAF